VRTRFLIFPSTSLSILLWAQRNVHDPRALAVILEKAEEELARKRHPDPYIRESSPNRCISHRRSHALQPQCSREVQSGTWRNFCLCDGLLTSLSLLLCVSGAVGTPRERNLPVCTPPSLARSPNDLLHLAYARSHLRPRSAPLILDKSNVTCVIISPIPESRRGDPFGYHVLIIILSSQDVKNTRDRQKA
jgi:hypothetical protein